MKAPLALALISGAGIALAAYTLDWSTLDSGGGQSSGGAYSVAGTIGQPDPGKMSGGGYTLTGGFWAMPELLQTPGGPPLEFYTVAGTTYLRWPAPSPGWRLQGSSDLTTWTDVATAPVAAENYLLVPAGAPAGPSRRCFRLVYP